MKFDYGELDLSFDNDPSNLTRLEKTVKLIKSLNQWSAQELFDMTYDSCEYNYNHVLSKDFWAMCEKHNQPTVEFLINL
jgi:hypothetical protein